MQLKVGELAKHTGLTVRTLHHYDEIGLLKPSDRSDSGYRLYSQGDVERLHAIQALRHLGLPLNDIAGLLAGRGASPQLILDQQLRALDQQITQANELRGRLALLRDGLVSGSKPGMGDWLGALSLMATYGKYFSAEELKLIFENWKPIEPEWLPLKAQIRDVMTRGVPPEAMEVQPLVSRWMSLMLHWMGGDFDLMERWGEMYRQEPTAQGRNNAPEGDMIDYVNKAVELRVALLSKYMPREDMRRIAHVPSADWAALQATVQALMDQGEPVSSAAARAAALRWHGLLERLSRGDARLRGQLMAAFQQEPLLQAGSQLSPDVRGYLKQVAQKMLDPHAT